MSKTGLSYILEMMSKIDSTHPDYQGEESDEIYPNENGQDAEVGDSDNTVDEPEADDEIAPVKPEELKQVPDRKTTVVKSINKGNPLKIGNSKMPETDNASEVAPRIAFSRNNTVGKTPHATRPETPINQARTFWNEKYVDTLANLQKIAYSDVDVATKIDTHIEQFDVDVDKYGIFTSRNNNEKPASFVPGYGMFGSSGPNLDHTAFVLILNTLCKLGIIDRSADIDSPQELNDLLDLGAQLAGNKQSLTIVNKLRERGILEGEELEQLKSRVKNILEKNFDGEKVSGLSNIQAKYFIDKMNTKITNDEFAGLLDWFPEDAPFLRSTCYAIRSLSKKDLKYIRPIRDLVFKTDVDRQSLFIKDSNIGRLVFSKELDDPINGKSIDELISTAVYILSKAINASSWDLPGIERSNFGGIIGKENTGYTSTFTYSVMDYIINLALVFNQKSKSKKTSTQSKQIFEDIIIKYFNIIDSVNKVNSRNNDKDSILSIIPLTAFFEENDGIEYLNSLLDESQDENTRNIISSVINEVLKTTRGKVRTYKLSFDNPSKLKLQRLNSEREFEDISESEHLTLFELFSEVIGQGRYKNQERLTNDIRTFLRKNGLDSLEVNTELNNNNNGNADSELTEDIGKKSIDISLPKYKILIEYQGEQHYTPSCCRGIKPSDMNFSKDDEGLEKIHASRGRDNDYLMKAISIYTSAQNARELRKSMPKFLTMTKFHERMEELTNEVIDYAQSNGANMGSIQKRQFLNFTWEYLGTLVNGGFIVDESGDAVGDIKKRPSWTEWGVVTSLVSRRRWYEEMETYLQQAADKQKFIKFKQNGWNIFYVCPPGGKIGIDLIDDQDKVPFVTDFTSFLDSNGRQKTIANYVDKSSLVAEGIYKIQGQLKPEFMASNFTYRFAESDNVDDMNWLNIHNNEIGYLGNYENLGKTIMNIVNKDKREGL